ncbi:cytoplasmic proline-tRNA ligase Prs1 [Schizosaccharomyces japonicus yFS275]|uniref:proline--tRNA ligase n=1 Tax=Schizosaccharomyces japonicus (strain yFS275 / FY16936) TaxID=402676 RepID=B6K068_SCHJY|nr:cytoplasmic proline-tRNA ligase Prs1 [Schizosaccharomyces japonicus yFS275]EEB06218.1 cytoplasmic proline-tRNA ligase Prs1 [Schizosaccharomyces japonicus yFS275]
MSVDKLVSSLKQIHLSEYPVVSHDRVENGKEWAAALQAANDVPAHSLTKTVVLKPKTPKSQEPVYLVVVSLDSTQSPSSIAAKSAGFKEARLAAADVVESVLGVKPSDVSVFSITSGNNAQVKVVLDDALVKSDKPLAFHPNTADKTLIVPVAAVQQYLESVGVKPVVVDFTAPVAAPAAKKAPAPKADASKAAIENAALIGVTVRKDLDFPGWYQQVLTKSDMIEYYDISGCYILKPWSYFIWEVIQKWFDTEIKKIGVKNGYFPLFVSSRVLEKEKDHVEGFAPEVAWVTRAGSSDLEEPIAIRPTSETVMYPYYAKWIRSHRDLPLRLNQWNSVVRWEFKNPQPFLRTREFLWQEGHTAFLTKEEADKEVHYILDLYSRVYSDLLALPVVKGVKSENEKFAGGLYTTTCEGYIPTTGRGIQGATSHGLGQNFSKMFNIAVEDPDAELVNGERPKRYIWQNSWGLSTRTIGVAVMVHGDDKGLKLPPAVASIQAIVVPCGITNKTTDAQRAELENKCKQIADSLVAGEVRAEVDLRSYTPGYKFAHWELKGVPLRIEYGPNDAKKEQVTAVRRDTFEKIAIPLANLANGVQDVLAAIQKNMYEVAKKARDAHIVKVKEWKDFVPALNKKNLVLIPWCNTTPCEKLIKEKSARQANGDEPEDEKAPSMGAKSLCIPLEQPTGEDAIVPGVTKCCYCGEEAKVWGLFGRSY